MRGGGVAGVLAKDVEEEGKGVRHGTVQGLPAHVGLDTNRSASRFAPEEAHRHRGTSWSPARRYRSGSSPFGRIGRP